MDLRNPLLERVKFLAIFSSNLDEFFMVRVAGLKDQVEAGFHFAEDKAGLTPKEQLASISKLNHQLVKLHYDTYHSLMIQLQKENIHLLKINQLNEEQIGVLEQLFDNLISPVLTPLAVDAYHPFPILLNKSINIAVTLRESGQKEKNQTQKLALVQVPRGLERFIALPVENSYEAKFVLLEEVIRHF